MKKPKDVDDLVGRLTTAVHTPLVAPAPADPAPVAAKREGKPAGKRKSPGSAKVAVFLRLSKDLFEHYDGEAMRRTKATGRGVTVQQVILDRLAETSA